MQRSRTVNEPQDLPAQKISELPNRCKGEAHPSLGFGSATRGITEAADHPEVVWSACRRSRGVEGTPLAAYPSGQRRPPFQLGSARRNLIDRQLATDLLGAPTQIGQTAAGDVGGGAPPASHDIDA